MEMDTEVKEKYYQWIRGENAGNVETWDGTTDSDGDITFLVFKGGGQINVELVPEFLVELSDPNDLMVDPNFLDIPQATKQKKAEKPKIESPKPTPKKDESNPVFALLDKSIKSESVQTLKVSLNLPPKDLIKVVASSFEDGQENVLDYLVSQIPVADLQKQIKEQLRQSLFTEKSSRKRNE